MRRAGPVTRIALLLAMLLAWSAPGPPRSASAVTFVRYSGHVMEVDLGRGVLVVEELGRRGQTIRHQVVVESDTPMIAASRQRGRSTAFGELPVSLIDVLVGDFVVVEGELLEEQGQTLAHRVTIVETRRKL
jgi:hypothetical protein